MNMNRMLDTVADALRFQRRDRIESLMVKNKQLNLRLSASDLAAIKASASKCGLSVSEYVLRCHEVVSAKLDKPRKPKTEKP